MAEYTPQNPPDQTPGNQAGAGANGTVAPDYLGRVEPQALTTEVEGSFVDYAMSVIVSRALPDARDGLKPVQRRILYAMHSDLRLRPGSPYKKSARIVGEVLGKYHPHGDGSVYESMARMVQDFSLRYPLVDGQGNFGSVDGDNPAAMRYTEARMARLAASMLSDIDEDTVAWKENFDDSLQEPVVLPAQVPNLLINGTTGIAVGMATNIPPHNLGEIVEAQKFIIDHWERRHSLTIDELMVYVKGPDFPLGGQILGTDGIREAFETGRGRIVVRAEGRIEEIPGRSRKRLVFDAIPYGVNKASLIARIADIVNKGERLQEIVDMRDESGRDGIRLVMELKSSATPQRVLNQVYKFSDLQMSFAVTLRALLENQPVVLNLRQALLCHLDHRIDVVERRTRFRREKVRARAHVLEGLLKALANIDRVVEIVRASDAAVEASTRLQSEFKLTERQAQEILDMPLRRLAALERQRLEDEYTEALQQIRGFTELLENPFKLRQVVREELDKLREAHQDPRKTRILYGVQPELSDEDLVVKQDDLVVVWQSQYSRRTLATEYRGQGLGGQGVSGRSDREQSPVEHLLYANSLDSYLFFTNRGRVYPCRAHALPEGSRTGRGETLRGAIPLEPEEEVQAILHRPADARWHSVVLVTRLGRIKRLRMSAFSRLRTAGKYAITLHDGDSIAKAVATNGRNKLFLLTAQGKGLLLDETGIRQQGSTASGVRGIRLKAGDVVADCLPVADNDNVVLLYGNGKGKRMAMGQWSAKGRNTQGNWATSHRRLDELGPIACAVVVADDKELAIATAQGKVMRTPVAALRSLSRSAAGIRIIRVAQGDQVASVAVVPLTEDPEADDIAPPPLLAEVEHETGEAPDPVQQAS